MSGGEGNSTFGQRVRAARKARGFSLDDLAAILGTDRGRLIAWEQDRQTPRKPEFREGLIRELGLAETDFPSRDPTGLARRVELLERQLAALAAQLASLQTERPEDEQPPSPEAQP